MGDRDLRARLERLQAELKDARALAGLPATEQPEVIALEGDLAAAEADRAATDARIAELEALVVTELAEMQRLNARVDALPTRWYETDHDAARRRATEQPATSKTNAALVVIGIILLFKFFL